MLLLSSLLLSLPALQLVPVVQSDPAENLHLHSEEPLVPLHMNSNITLTPIHMHSKDPYMEHIYEPRCTYWHELSPHYCVNWHLTSWNDTQELGEPGYGELSPNDQIDMTDESGMIKWFHVDRMTITLNLSSLDYPGETIFVEFKGPPDMPIPDVLRMPVCTLWHEVWSIYSNVWHIIDWKDNGNGVLDVCDSITLNLIRGTIPPGIYNWHVDGVSNDLILREKIMDPRCTWWHEIHPNYCEWWHVTSWEDNGDGMLSPSDQIDMSKGTWDLFWSMGDVNRDGYINQTDLDRIVAKFGWPGPWPIPEDINSDQKVGIEDVNICTSNLGKNFWEYFETTWYHVDRVTLTLNVTSELDPTSWAKIELKTQQFEEMYHALKHPNGTMWHEIYPFYSCILELTRWDWQLDDNCNGVLDVCDYIWLINWSKPEPGTPERYHVEDICYDIILNKKITDPVCTYWNELHPAYGNRYHIIDWEDNGDNLLSPCDSVYLDPGPIQPYHVENVTLTLLVSNASDPSETMYIEYKGPFETMYDIKTNPLGSFWHEVYPMFDPHFELTKWYDNCNGVLSKCDMIDLTSIETTSWHIEEVAIDIVVKPPAVLVHDVAVTHVSSSYPWVYQGQVDPIVVNVTNKGGYTETVDVYAFYDGNLAAPKQTTSLNPGETKKLTFNWNTMIVPPGTYTISANATIPVDNNPADNYLKDGTQEVRGYFKPPYPDYAPSGMPDFDQRQDPKLTYPWWWRAWAFPDAVAVWQHNQTVPSGGQHGTWDWEIYYSIYTDPNMWWTLGTDNARPLVLDWPGHGAIQFIPGDDKNPAISWYSSNYAICVWQHWNGINWDIWYSRFIPNVGWTTPGSLHGALDLDDTDPAIAFDTNGWAVCVWVHGTPPGPTVVYYSVWNPTTLSWVGPNNVLSVGIWPGKAAMPEVDVDSKHNVVAIWTDAAVVGKEQVYYSWAPFAVPVPPFLAWTAPAVVPGCPTGVNWQKGISPDQLGNNLIDFGLPAPIPGGEPLYFAQFTSPAKAWSIPTTNLTVPWTNGEHPDLAFDFNNNAIAVYTNWPGLPWPAPGPLYFSFWNGVNWAPVGGAYAVSANTGTHDQWPALAFIKNNKAVLVWESALNTTPPGGPQSYDTDVFFSIYTPPYPPGAWTPAAFIASGGVNNPNGGSIPSLRGDDCYVDIASPTGSPTTPLSVPLPPPAPITPTWTWCGPTAVANSLWWLDSKFETINIPPPTNSDGFPLVRSYKPHLWDDHDPQNVPYLIEHLAWLMDTDGQRTRLCHCGTTVWDMQAGIAQYLSWSGVNPLGDANGDGVVNQTDVNLINAAMGSTPGSPTWNLAADIWPETLPGPFGRRADNIVNASDLNLVNANLGKTGMFYEHTEDAKCRTDFFYYIEAEVEKSQDVVLLLGIYQGAQRIYGHFVTVAGVNSTTLELLISNPIRDDFEAGRTPGRSPVPHWPHTPPEPPYTTHNNASLVSHDAYHVVLAPGSEYHWILEGYEADPTLTARIEFAVITSPYPGVHDINVTKVSPLKTIVGQNYTCPVNVTVLNEGTFTETFNVTLYANTTAIENKTVTLQSGNSTVLTFRWNTTGWVKGNYTIKAIADTVPGETDTADNTRVDGWVYVGLVGDVNADGIVDIEDIYGIALAYGSFYNTTDGQYWHPTPCDICPHSPNLDINWDVIIDIQDIYTAALHYGEIDP